MNKVFRNIDDYEVIYPDVIGATVSDDIVFTKAAMTEILRFLEEELQEKTSDPSSDRTIRLSVVSSADYAKRYFISVTSNITDKDRIFELHKLKIIIDSKSLFYFMGVIIDFIDNKNGRGFLFIDSYNENYIIPSEQIEVDTNKNILKNKIFC